MSDTSKKHCFNCRRIKEYKDGINYGAGSWMCEECLIKAKEENNYGNNYNN